MTLDSLPMVIPEFWAIMTIIQEAESEGLTGMQAVAEVIRRRTNMKLFSDGTYSSTCLWPYQFSGWNTKDPNRARVAKLTLDDPIVLTAIQAWRISKNSNMTNGATHYLNPKTVGSISLPEWAAPADRVAVIGNHEFYLVK